jgi:hypothetical protein
VNDSVIFVDTETTGLDPERHEVWDIAMIEADGTEHEWHLRPENFHRADEGALRVTKFYERVKAAGYREETVEEGYPKRATKVSRANFWTPDSRVSVASQIGALTANKHLVGAVPWFDARFLAAFMAREGYVPAWHYHMIDVETLAVGYLAAYSLLRQADRVNPEKVAYEPPWESSALAITLGINPDNRAFGKHTAIGDARWAKAIYEKVMA